MRDKLIELGATNPSGSEGWIYIKEKYLSPQIIAREEIDTTPLRERLRLQLAIARAQFVIFPCLFRIRLRCRKKTQVYYIPPVIDYDILPLKIKNLTLHIWGLWLEGDITNKFSNQSKEGQKVTEEDGKEIARENVQGSADLFGEFLQKMKSLDLDKLMDEIRDKIERTRPLTSLDITTHFEVKGWGEVIWNLITLLITGKIKTYDGYNITLKYPWLGEERMHSKHIDQTIELPVEGNIRWVWS